MDELTPDEMKILRKKLLESGIALSLDLVKGSLPMILKALKDLDEGNQVRYFGENKRGPIKTSFNFGMRTLDDLMPETKLQKRSIDEFTELEEKKESIEIIINKKLDEKKTTILVKDRVLLIHSEGYKNRINLPSGVKSMRTEFRSGSIKIILNK